jgi:hypothetical protein
MKVGMTLFSVALLAVLVVGLVPSTSSGVTAVSDAEAAALYGGCIDVSTYGPLCGESGEGNCSKTRGAETYVNGSGKQQDVNCGASSCGTVPLTSGTCEG